MEQIQGAGQLPAPWDPYQERYLAHQARKRKVLVEIMRERHSSRMFADEPPAAEVIEGVLETASMCPSSCDRRAVTVHLVTDRDDLALLGGLLVGGVGWIHRAPVVGLLFADPLAYKAIDEQRFMPYLDAGVIVQQLYLAATAAGLACCYVNPNIRPMNREHFALVFGRGIFCGAFAMGYPQ
jgi:nitroreductase